MLSLLMLLFLLLLFFMMFTLAQTRETLLRHATNATGDRSSSVDAVDARWQICSVGTHRLPQTDVCKIGFFKERGRGNTGWPCHLLDRAGCK